MLSGANTSGAVGAAITVASLGLVTCSSEQPALQPACVKIDTSCAPLYAATYDEVFTRTLAPTCGKSGVSCHSTTGHQGGLAFEDADTAFRLLGERGRRSGGRSGVQRDRSTRHGRRRQRADAARHLDSCGRAVLDHPMHREREAMKVVHLALGAKRRDGPGVSTTRSRARSRSRAARLHHDARSHAPRRFRLARRSRRVPRARSSDARSCAHVRSRESKSGQTEIGLK